MDIVPSIANTEILSSFWKEGFPIIIEKAGPLLGILQTAGIVLIIYWIFLIVRGILNMKDRRRLKRVEAKVDHILQLLEKNKKRARK
jgi:hypothetical protein